MPNEAADFLRDFFCNVDSGSNVEGAVDEAHAATAGGGSVCIAGTTDATRSDAPTAVSGVRDVAPVATPAPTVVPTAADKQAKGKGKRTSTSLAALSLDDQLRGGVDADPLPPKEDRVPDHTSDTTRALRTRQRVNYVNLCPVWHDRGVQCATMDSVSDNALHWSQVLEHYDTINLHALVVDAQMKATTYQQPKKYWDAIARPAPEGGMFQEAADGEVKFMYEEKVVREIDARTLQNNELVMNIDWVPLMKFDEHGNASRARMRLTPKGFEQQAGLDYDVHGITSPVAQRSTVLCILSLIVKLRLRTRQYDGNSQRENLLQATPRLQ